MNKIAFIDLETTGTEITKDRICQIAIKIISRESDAEHWILGSTYCRYINPGMPIPSEATEVHGITDADVADAPTFAQVGEKLSSYIAGCMIGGFNSDRFDIPMLMEEFARCGIFPPRMKSVDVMRLYHKMEPRKLQDAVKLYTGNALDNAHDAGADIDATVEVFLAQQKIYDLPNIEQYINSYEDNDAERLDYEGKIIRNKDGQIVFNFGKEKGNPVTSLVGRGFALWCLSKDFISMDTKYIIRSVLDGKIV